MRSTVLSFSIIAIVLSLSACSDHRAASADGAVGPPDDATVGPPSDAASDAPSMTTIFSGEFALAGNGDVVISTVPVTGQSFDSALSLVTVGPYANEYATQLVTTIPTPISQGDVLLATFWVRCERSLLESGACKTEYVFERNSSPWTKSVDYPVSAGKDWMQFFVGFKAAESYAPNGAHTMFRLGFPNQTVQIGGFSLVNYGKSVDLSQLPTTTIHYVGEAPDAPWRAEADQRIEAIRKGDLTITVQDSAGQPVMGATVAVKMKRHAFAFGTAISSGFMKTGALDQVTHYQQEVVALFNTVVEENALKWKPLAGDWGSFYNIDLAQWGVDWARSQGLAVRGHNLVWPSWTNSPVALKKLLGTSDGGGAVDAAASIDAADDGDAGDDGGSDTDAGSLASTTGPEAVRAAVRKHITDTVTAMAGKLIHWDVVNEPFDNHDITDLPGFGLPEMVEWFKLARQADPVPKLFINDYAILAGGGGTTAHRDFYEQIVKDLLAGGAPLDGLGMQGHFGLNVTAPDDALAILDRFGKLGPEIWITEFDMVVNDLDLAGRYTRDILTLVFSHAKVGGFIMWGFWDGAHYAKNAPIYDKDWNLKPAGQAYKDLVFSKWWTDTTCTSDASGLCLVRGFLGDYELTVTSGSTTKVVPASMPTKAGQSITITLP
jgi:GH35 family endo-1,4-beta-xylanase